MDNDLLNALSDGADKPGFLKAGFLGFPKSGKTFTAVLLALAVRRHFKLPGQVAMFDTEGGSVYIRPIVQAITGQDLLAKRARSFDAMCQWGQACVKAGVSVAIVDSVTHPWRELCDSYLAQKAEEYERRGWSKPTRLEFPDWNILKPRWGIWTDFYLNSPLHIVICGRAGWEYEMETNEKGKKELIKSGTKMKTETEFGFEPSLLVEVERMERPQPSGPTQYVRQAAVLGDRFSLIDGKLTWFPSVDVSKPEELAKAVNAVADFFGPHIAALSPGGTSAIDMEGKSQFIFEGGEEAWAAEKKRRTILCEEIQGELVTKWPGQTAAEKQQKTDMLSEVFGTRSWTKVENTDAGKLSAGLKLLREKIAEKNGQTITGEDPPEVKWEKWLQTNRPSLEDLNAVAGDAEAYKGKTKAAIQAEFAAYAEANGWSWNKAAKRFVPIESGKPEGVTP